MKQKKIIISSAIAILLVSAVVSYMLFDTSKSNDNNVAIKIENGNTVTKVNFGEDFFLKDLVNDTSLIQDAYFENGDIFSIDENYVITSQHNGIDTLVINYKNNSYEKYKFASVGKTIDIKYGETIDYEKNGINVDNIDNLSTDNDLLSINEKKVTAVGEGKSILIINYQDGSSDYIEVNVAGNTSNATTSHTWTFMCSENEKCWVGKYGNFTTVSITANPSFVGKNLIDYWSSNEMPTQDGYYFEGFYTEPNGKGAKYVDHFGNIIKDDLQTRNLYAYWTKSDCSNPHSITFDCQSGKNDDICNVTLNTCTSTVGNYINNNANDSFPKRDGYTFQGFYTETDGKGTKITDENGKFIYDDLRTKTIYAHWTKESTMHYITFSCSSGVSCWGPIGTSYTFLGRSIVTDWEFKLPTKTGYTLDGFYTEQNGKGTKVIDSTGKIIYDNGKSLTVYDYWKKNDCQNQHSITYDCQGGKSNGNGITCNATLHTCSSVVGNYIGNNDLDSYPIRDDYTFNGFYTEPDGKGTKVTDNKGKYIYDDLKTRTIYAYWTKKNNCSNPHNITYDCQGGKNDDICNVTLNTCTSTIGNYINNNDKDSYPIREGYKFNGFYTETDGKGTKVTDNKGKYIYDDLKTRTIYAHWTKENTMHYITFSCSSGVSCWGPIGTSHTFLGESLVDDFEFKMPTKTGYILNGFYTEKNGKGTKVIDSTGKIIYDNGKSLTVYDYWSPMKIEIIYHRNTNQSDTTTYNQTIKSSNSNKCFGCNINGSGFAMKASNSGFGNWTNKNYIFLGWARTSTSNTNSYAGNATISNSFIDNVYYKKYSGQKKAKAIDLYAIWVPKTMTISLSLQGGTNKDSNISNNKIYLSNYSKWCYNTTCSKTITNIKTPTRAGYTFKGYYTATTNGKLVINTSGSINKNNLNSKSKTVYLYARWSKNTTTDYPDKINGNRCYVDGNTRILYYITECEKADKTSAKCKFTKKGNKNASGTVLRNKLRLEASCS